MPHAVSAVQYTKSGFSLRVGRTTQARIDMPRALRLAALRARAHLDGKGCKPGCLCCPVLVRPMINRCVTSTGCDVPEGAKLPDDDGT